MLGHVLSYEIEKNQNFELFSLSKNSDESTNHFQCDIRNHEKLKSIITKLKPEIIINCIGLLVSDSKNNIHDAIIINSYLPHFLKFLSDQLSFKIIHISTDCVFSGLKGNYDENSEKDAQDEYGKTKSIGELNYTNHLTIRTSIIGPEINNKKRGLLQWLFSQTGKIDGYSKVIWSGVTTVELSKSIIFAIQHNLGGIWHLTNQIPISKFELLSKLITRFKIKNVNLNKDKSYFSNKSLITIRNIDYQVPSYDIMIDELYHFIKKRNLIYKLNYFDEAI